MPIEHDFPVNVLSQDEFHAIDRVVMRQAFDVQNELGRFYKESVYRNELEFRLRSLGMPVLAEAPVRVVFRDFVKYYFLDSLVGNGAVYEFKMAEALVGGHEKQLLNYLFLLGVHHGKLINLFPKSVEHRFVSTRLTHERRRNMIFDDSSWNELCVRGLGVRQLLEDLLFDWGAFLERSLYAEALTHFFCPEDLQGRPVNICVGGRVVGRQDVCLLEDDVSLHVSAITKNHLSYQRHLERIFEHTCLTRIQWINFNRDKVEMVSLKK